jgi:predicted PurR-regulated permease PerM
MTPSEPLGDQPPDPIHLPTAERRRLSVLVLLAVSAGAAYLLGRILWPFAAAIILALVLAVLAHPLYRRLRRRLGSENLAAFLGTTVLFFLVFIPLSALSFALFDSIQGSVDTVFGGTGELLAPGGLVRGWLDRVTDWLGLEEASVIETLRGQITELGAFVAERTVGLLSGLGGGMIQAGVALFTLFYLLRDGDAVIDASKRVLPLDEELVDVLIDRSAEIIFATVYGSIVVAIVQGALGGIAFWAVGMPGAVLWGVVMAFLSLLPAVGPPLIWGPAAAILLLQGEVWRPLVLIAVGALVVGTVDNLLRAYLVSGRAQVHPLVVFFSVLGGILLFGLMGIFLGPILFVASLSMLETARLALEPGKSPRTTEIAHPEPRTVERVE